MFLIGYFVVLLAGLLALLDFGQYMAVGLAGAAMMVLGVVEHWPWKGR